VAEQGEQDDRNGVPDSVTGLVPFLLKCDVETLRRSASGSITGNLYVELGTTAFPDRGWSDFVVVVLAWWLRALSTLVEGAGSADLQFMDGPFSMSLTAVDLSTCTLECVQRGARATVVLCKANVNIVEFGQQVERVAAQVVTACHVRGWQASDIDALRDLSGRLAPRPRQH